jgi:hypothetical protein
MQDTALLFHVNIGIDESINIGFHANVTSKPSKAKGPVTEEANATSAARINPNEHIWSPVQPLGLRTSAQKS